MSQESIRTENENEKENIVSEPQVLKSSDAEDSAGDIRIAVRKKRFKKSDILVLVVCIVTSFLIWLYASDIQRKAAEKEISKEDIVEVITKNTEAATEIVTEAAQ